MKKFLMLLGVFVFSFSLIGCNTEHKHTLIQHEAKEATCTEAGHNAYEECTECDYTTYVKIDALGHIEVIDEKVEPTCTEAGLTEGKHCSRCNEVLIKQNTITASGHNHKSEVTDPTCEEDGYTTYICDCGDSYVSDYVDALGHKEIASCIGTICNICKDKFDETVNLDIHVSYDESTGKCECGKDITPLAKIGNLYCETFDVALENWVDGTTLTLLSDVTGLTECIKTTSKGLILDLNGYKIECSDSWTIWIDGDSKSELTIRDSVGNGYIQGQVYAVGGSKFRLESGTIEKVTANGDFTMTGGCINSTKRTGLYINDYSDIIISGGEIIGPTGIWNTIGNVIISGSPKIVGTNGYAIYNFNNLTISGTPNISGTTGEINTSKKITLNTQPNDSNKWRIAIDTNDITDGIFAVPGENIELDINKFASNMEGYEVKINDKGELLLCNHATSYHSVSNGDDTHNKTCHCGGSILETNIPCTGGTATDTYLAICEYCGKPYGELDPNNHFDIDAVNMNADELYKAVLELIQTGDKDISIFFGDIAIDMYDSINKAINDSNVEEDSINLTLNSMNGVENEEQLVKAIENDGIILITGDIELSELNNWGINITKDTTIILNGYTITGVHGTFYVDGATLTILGKGTLTMVEENKNVGFTIDVINGGVLNLQNGTVEGWLNASYEGTVNINGGFVEILSCYEGTIIITDGSIENVDCYVGTVIIDGGTITEEFYISDGTATITGGTFNFNPSKYVDLENYTVTEQDGVYTVTAK